METMVLEGLHLNPEVLPERERKMSRYNSVSSLPAFLSSPSVSYGYNLRNQLETEARKFNIQLPQSQNYEQN